MSHAAQTTLKNMVLVSVCAFSALVLLNLVKPANAATGINHTINFQGKVVNSDGTNVTNGTYDFTFKIYSTSSGGSPIWTENWNSGTSQVTVTNGIFQVALGTHTSLPGSVDFNTDNIYLGIEFNGDGEMDPRVRFTSVPYAFEAEKVNGLTVTNTTGTLTVANNKTLTVSDSTTLDTNSITFAGSEVLSLAASKNVSFADAFTTSGAHPITLTATNTTNLTLPTTGTLSTLDGGETLTNKTLTDNLNAFADNGDASKLLKFDVANVGTGTTLTLAIPSSPGTSDTLCLQTKNNCGGAGGLFTDGGSFSYLTSTTDDLVLGASTVANAAFYMQITDGGSPAYSTLFLGTNESKNGRLTLYSSGVGKTDPSIYTNSLGDLLLSAPSGTIDIGNSSGDIQLSLLTVNDNFIADKTIDLSSSYNQDDFTFKRVLTSNAVGETQSGSVLYIEDSGDGTGTTVNGDLIKANSALIAGSFSGNLLNLQVGGSDKFTVNATGAISKVAGATSSSGIYNYDFSASTGDFLTSSGTITLSGTTTVAANKNFSLAAGTGVFSQSYTGTSTASTITANSVQTNHVLSLSGTSLTTGNVLRLAGGTGILNGGGVINIASATTTLSNASDTAKIANISFTNTSTNTAGTTSSIGLNIAPTNTSGVSSGAIMETYGAYIQAIAGTLGASGAGTQNNYGLRVGNQGQSNGENAYGIYLDAQSGSTTNYALYSAGGQSYFAGNVGIGDDQTPDATFEIEDNVGEQFRLGYDNTHYYSFGINSSGNLSLTPTGGNTVTLASGVTTLTASGVTSVGLGASPTVTAASGNISLSGTATGNSASLFVLPIKTDATDPTTSQTAGGMYYNSNAGKFRCYQSGWTDCIGSGTGGVSATGTQSNNQIAFFTGDDALNGSNNFTWDNTNQQFGIVGATGATTSVVSTISSAATGLTTGGLLKTSYSGTSAFSGSLNQFEYAPSSAPSSSPTGDILRLSLGSNATNFAGNYLNILNSSGSSVLSVSDTAFTSALPTNFTASGDVSVAYDINFTNPTASFIKSGAPLYLVAGETFNSSNLTMQTYNEGQIVLSTANVSTTAVDLTNSDLTTGTGLGLTFSGLTSGSAQIITSAATSFTGVLEAITLSGNSASNSGNLLKLTNSGASNTGDVLVIANSGTGKDITGTASSWSVTKAGVASFAGFSSTINMNGNPITNIGATGSSFTTSGSLALILDAADANGVLSIDNAAQSSPIFVAKDNGTMVFQIADNGLLTIDPTTTGTVANFALATQWTTGTMINGAFGSSTTQSGAITGVSLGFGTNLTPLTSSTSSLTGYDLTTPTVSNSSATTYTISGYSISSAGSLTVNNASAAITWKGINLNLPTITQTNGAVTADGISLTIPSSAITTAGTLNGINIPTITTGPAAGTLNGFQIGNISTPGNGVENGIKIGTGWDNEINFVDSTVNLSLSATDNTAELAIKDNCSSSCTNGGTSPNTLLHLRDLSTNFGAAVTAGAFISQQSYFGEEFNNFHINNGTADWNLGRGDLGNPNTAAGTAGGGELTLDVTLAGSGTAAVSSLADTANGVERMTAQSNTAASSSSVVMEYLGAAAIGNAQQNWLAANLPVFVAKVRPSLTANTNGRVFVGLSDMQAPTSGTPSNGIFFSNCTTAGATPTCSGTSWIGMVTSSGSSLGSVTCTGTISTTNFAYLRIEVRKTGASAGEVHFYADVDTTNGIQETECGTGVTGITIPASTMSILLKSEFTTNTTTAETLDIDYVRIWQDDNVPAATINTDGDLVANDVVANLQNIDPEQSAVNIEDQKVTDGLTVEQLDFQLKQFIASNSAEVHKLKTDINLNNEAVASISAKLETNKFFQTGGLATGSADLATLSVTNESFFYGVVQIFETLTTRNLVVAEWSKFMSDVFFNANVKFLGLATFNSDTAGTALIKKDAQEVEVTFDKEYPETPMVTITPNFTDNMTDDQKALLSPEAYQQKVEEQKQLEEKILNSDLKFIVTRKSKKGFVIKLSKPADQDISFSWQSTSVDNPKVFESKLGDIIASPIPSSSPITTQIAHIMTQIEGVSTSSAMLAQNQKTDPQPAKAAPVVITINPTETGFLRVRKEPKTNSEEVGQVTPGNQFTSLEQTKGVGGITWYKIEFQRNQFGWLKGSYVKATGNESQNQTQTESNLQATVSPEKEQKKE